ncbi:Os07g0597666 [Oryza sativa Japonica Group]|uniref:Os07g0597666 protein n=1 Tax=Oryza sativa subsp. japonica TaxID=39947 RepID=A0A0P0X8H9_ORYSJ|nr:Os07g0597666 [Oryza sativa Japonica Group]
MCRVSAVSTHATTSTSNRADSGGVDPAGVDDLYAATHALAEVDVVDPRADGDDAAERRDGVEELGADADGPAAEDEDDARWVGVGGHRVE